MRICNIKLVSDEVLFYLSELKTETFYATVSHGSHMEDCVRQRKLETSFGLV
jgi:hypothetical protein